MLPVLPPSLSDAAAFLVVAATLPASCGAFPLIISWRSDSSPCGRGHLLDPFYRRVNSIMRRERLVDQVELVSRERVDDVVGVMVRKVDDHRLLVHHVEGVLQGLPH